jgi:biotin carboxyl carrier protein
MSSSGKKGVSKEKPSPPLEDLQIGSVMYATRLTFKFKNRKPWKRPDEKKVVSVIPGTIQNLMVKKGDEVVAGTPLLILEAMKMRNEIRAHDSGVVKKIYIKKGEQVPKDHLLLEFM